MPITSAFNSIKYLTQNMRFGNMAQIKDSKPSARGISGDQVEVRSDLSQYAEGSTNTGHIINAIQRGKGRVPSRAVSVNEDGGALPEGVQPARQIKNIAPIINYDSIQKKIVETNEMIQEKVNAEHAIEVYQSQKKQEVERVDVEPVKVERVEPEPVELEPVELEPIEAPVEQVVSNNEPAPVIIESSAKAVGNSVDVSV